jgi:hypothetical protein
MSRALVGKKHIKWEGDGCLVYLKISTYQQQVYFGILGALDMLNCVIDLVQLPMAAALDCDLLVAMACLHH